MAAVLLAAGGCASGRWSNLASVKLAAEKGNPRAEYQLARRYAHGEGVMRDEAKAAEYLRQSADQRYAPAQAALGSCYARGLGVRQDYSLALRWYRKAAAQGDALAEYCLGYACAHGKGVPKDIDKALDWWRKSAEQGQVYAQNALGQFYLRGEQPGDTNHVDYVASAKWLRQAAQQGCVSAMNNLAFLYQNGWGVKHNLREAVRWYRRAAQAGDAMAQANLGLLYQDGDGGLPYDRVEAYKWFVLSAEQGNVIGKHSFDEYNVYHVLTPAQFAQARKRVAKFKARRQKRRSTPWPAAEENQETARNP